MSHPVPFTSDQSDVVTIVAYRNGVPIWSAWEGSHDSGGMGNTGFHSDGTQAKITAAVRYALNQLTG